MLILVVGGGYKNRLRVYFDFRTDLEKLLGIYPEGIGTLITDDGITTFDYELHYVTIMECIPSLVRKMQEEHHIDKVWVSKDTRKLYMKYLRKEENNA